MNMDFDSKGSISLPAGQDPVFDINSNISLAPGRPYKSPPCPAKEKSSASKPCRDDQHDQLPQGRRL